MRPQAVHGLVGVDVQLDGEHPGGDVDLGSGERLGRPVLRGGDQLETAAGVEGAANADLDPTGANVPA